MWTEITEQEKAKVAVFGASVRQGAPHYSGFKDKNAEDYLTAFHGVLYWYNDGIYRIALSMYVVPREQLIKVANCLVVLLDEKKGTPEECVKIVVRKVREYMDAKGIRRAYAIVPNSTFTPFQDAFHDALDAMNVWEYSKVLEDGSDSHPQGVWRKTFDREPARKGEDEVWEHAKVA